MTKLKILQSILMCSNLAFNSKPAFNLMNKVNQVTNISFHLFKMPSQLPKSSVPCSFEQLLKLEEIQKNRFMYDYFQLRNNKHFSQKTMELCHRGQNNRVLTTQTILVSRTNSLSVLGVDHTRIKSSVLYLTLEKQLKHKIV